MYPEKNKYENLEKLYCDYDGQYDIPKLRGCNIVECPQFIGFNYAKTTSQKDTKGVHFFIDDYQFNRLWARPDDYINLLKQYMCVMTPDFSLYTDFPKAMQIYNHYRKHWLGAYWESHGIKVIPTIGWSDESSFEWCFDGEPKHSLIAVSSIGTQKSKKSKEMFLKGYSEMIKRLSPEKIIFYGNIPSECRGNIVRIKALQAFGGRGGSWRSGAISADGVILKGESMHVERLTGSSFYSSSPQIALEAVTDGKGNLTLKWASESGYREQNSKSTYAQYDIKAGITNLHPQGKHTVDLVSVNINWDKVKTVSGKTYGTQRLMREQGFKWDGVKKIWTR